MAQKVIEGDVDTWRHMHEILRWPKIRTIHFLYNFSSKYPSRVKILRWPTFFTPNTLRWPKIRKEMDFEAKMVRILGRVPPVIYDCRNKQQNGIWSCRKIFEDLGEPRSYGWTECYSFATDPRPLTYSRQLIKYANNTNRDVFGKISVY